MKIKMTQGTRASLRDIKVLEQTIGTILPKAFAAWVSEYDGGTPEQNSFQIGRRLGGATRFIRISLIIKEMKNIENLPPSAIPIAWAEGGNYLILMGDGSVFFWDHEEPEPLLRISDTFENFLEQLEPFDISKVELNPGDVKVAWIDPEFLKGLQ